MSFFGATVIFSIILLHYAGVESLPEIEFQISKDQGLSANVSETISPCSSSPCLNGGVCSSLLVNDTSFNCSCPAGFTGKLCQKKIDYCQPSPCQNGATCIDSQNGFTCSCAVGYTGEYCEADINECLLNVCKNGHCVNSVGSYQCFCTPGYTGDHCELDIDECLSHPCFNGATCVNAVNRFNCICTPGFTGRSCKEDINECKSNPCQFGGTCVQRSDVSLYSKLDLSTALPLIHPLNYNNNSITTGYECICPAGFSGNNCETDVNECESHHCRHGSCKDGIGSYTCECEEGFEGTYCEIDIDECERYKPCIHGTCYDRRAGYFCDCNPKYGGKNCSVELIGCNQEPACLNNGTCKPYLVGETLHKFNCTCPNGFHGAICEKITTMSLNEQSHIVVNTSRDEGYDISFRFKTTLPSGLLALGRGSTFYILELVNGRLNLHSSLLNKWEGVFIGSQLNDSNWQKVFVAINSSHVVLSANEEQTIYPINLNEAGTTNHTSFPTTYVGGTGHNLQHLTHARSIFIGCVENIVINGQWVLPGEMHTAPIEVHDVDVGCQRKDQCKPNPCQNGGQCADLWKNFSCSCQRPYLGNTCQYNLTAATFGHENLTNSLVTVSIFDQAKKAVRNIVDISMFIRTRQQKGAIFYLGSFPGSQELPEETHITAELDSGELLVRIKFNGTLELCTVGGVKLNDGYNHLIEVIRNVTLVQVKINETEYFRKTISASGSFNAQVLYLGGLPMKTNDEILMADSLIIDYHRGSRDAQLTKLDTISSDPHISKYIRQTADKFDHIPHFKGIIQDVQINNGSFKMIVEFFPLNVTDLFLPELFGNVSFDSNAVLKGVFSDNVCASNPCVNNTVCVVTWNDYICNVDINDCSSQPCLNGGTCIDGLGFFNCKCPNEFVGKQCEQIRQITCDDKLCKNDAHCIDIPNQSTNDNFTCSCLDGFSGTYCDKMFCSVTPCMNDGLCVIKNKAPMCECQKGFIGKYCEENIDDCQIVGNNSSPCLNGGRCIDGIGNYICNCTSTGYKGERCNIDINECIEGIANCGKRETCKNENGSYKCECNISVCSNHCDSYDPCLEMPCQNGGTCREKCINGSDYECLCLPNYIGKNCTEIHLYAEEKVSDIIFIIVPVVLVLLLALVGSLAMLFMMARNKRATRGTYSPSSQEYCNPRVELDNVMKPPPEERLI